LPLPPHASHHRDALQALYKQLEEQTRRLDDRVKHAAEERPRATTLMTHPGVGPVTALATEVFVGDPSRFADGKAVGSYFGMIPSEYSSGRRQRLGRLSKTSSISTFGDSVRTPPRHVLHVQPRIIEDMPADELLSINLTSRYFI